jgi:sugar phosphate isomerase/epimerase
MLAAQFASDSEDGEFDLLAFTIRAFELAPTKDIAWLAEHGIDGREFFTRELKPCWEDQTREQRAAKIASFVRFANLLDRSDPEPGTSVTERLWELRSSVRTKIVLLASAYDCQYGDSYCRRIAKDPQRFGEYELSHTLTRA